MQYGVLSGRIEPFYLPDSNPLEPFTKVVLLFGFYEYKVLTKMLFKCKNEEPVIVKTKLTV